MSKNKIILLAISGLLLSCQVEDTELKEVMDQNVSDQRIETETNILDWTPGVYSKYFQKTDNTIGFNSLKAHAFSNYSDTQTMNFPRGDEQYVSVNGRVLQRNDRNELKLSSSSSNIYGKPMTITVSRKGEGKSSETSEEVTMYVPKKLNVSTPVPPNNDKITTVAYYKDFLLEWNADPKNEHGLMVAVEYKGENVNAENNTFTHVQNVDHIENDNGKYILDNSMFDGIPNLSFVDIILLRGNIRIDDIDGETIKTYAESHQRIPILLVKDLNTVKTFD